ncbi:hypothetical protein N5D48_05235 [Pseudomonas sp. GD03858]|uniref:hypothetical protein n=1 Tax=unclassified Pseudomonas TaxID=196821 RepID=UPI00244C4434|nr:MULTISPECIES: hypothetical protein [unclassified Pseudomonas]MDH0646203.1 hypothetical protein [Pseudomonas sp. GD03867]MDH0661798.1 hypothetical protein [Pseudomonas sp. GD03858]
MNREISDEINTLFNVVRRRLDTETPDSVSPSLPLYSNKLQDEEIEAIRSGLEAKLASAVSGFVPHVALGRAQDENEAGSLIVSFTAQEAG